MEICDCIGRLNLNEGIIIEELKTNNGLANAVYHDSDVDYMDRDKLISILFRAVQELKTEIEELKNQNNTIKNALNQLLLESGRDAI